MRYLILMPLIIAGILLGCRNQPRDTKKQETKSKSSVKPLLNEQERHELYQKVKEKKISELSDKEKQKTIEDWIMLLRNDPDFVNAENSLQDYTSEIINRDRDKDAQNQTNRPDREKDQVRYLESRGIQNPEKAASSRLNLIKSYLILFRKYPELKELDKPTRTLILKQAAKNHSFSTIKKNSHK